jgi:hypothetical protein
VPTSRGSCTQRDLAWLAEATPEEIHLALKNGELAAFVGHPEKIQGAEPCPR